MATGSTAVETIAKAAGILPATVERTARTLKEAKIDAWPLGRPGGGHSAPHVDPHHLVCLILALSGAQPSDAVATVAALFSLHLQQWDRAEEVEPETRYRGASVVHSVQKRNQLLQTNSLGADLVRMIAALGEGNTALAEELRAKQWTLILNPTRPVARQTWRDPAAPKVLETKVYAPEQASLLDQLPSTGVEPRAQVSRETTIPFALIEVAAELWGDTLAHRGSLPLSGDAPASADPESENAAPPARGTAPTRDQPPKETAGIRNTSDPEASDFSFSSQGKACERAGGRETLAGGMPGRTIAPKVRSHERTGSADPPHSVDAAAA